MKKHFLLIALIFTLNSSIHPCTTAIISGKATRDGRPLLWKNRDAREIENKLMFFHGEKYDFVGVVNTKDTTGTQVWMGSNSAGFSIMNTSSYNLYEEEDPRRPKDEEGFLMKEALGQCATLADFEEYLARTKGKWGINTNIGAIDARGGAAYYETITDAYEKFDVNDPKVAPSGYLIRTNFSLSGYRAEGGGYIRYKTAEDIFFMNHLKNNLSLEFLLLDASRCLKHSLLNTDLYNMDLPDDDTQTQLIPFIDYIPGHNTASVMVIQGVKPGEDPQLTTLWTILGFPLTTLTVPVWVAAGDNLPEITLSKNGELAPMNQFSFRVKEKCYPLPFHDGRAYLNLPALLNKKGTGALQKILPEDRNIMSKTSEAISKWRETGFNKTEALNLYKWLDNSIPQFYQKTLALDTK